MIAKVFAEFPSAETLIEAAKKLHQRGYRALEAFTPYALPEIEEHLGIPRTKIPWLALGAALSGIAIAFGIISYCNGYSYPLDVGGRPIYSLPADVPIAFETAVLLAGITTFAAVLGFSGMPRLHHPFFEVEGHERASLDRFILGIDTAEPAYDPAILAELEALGAVAIRRLDEAKA